MPNGEALLAYIIKLEYALLCITIYWSNMNKIIIKGAREHNLKNIDVELPRDQLVVISGLSGSGKSSLAFDTIFAEGQRRYVESLSSYARMFLGRMEKPDLDYIEGLSPAISIEQKTTHRNPRSTVGTVTEIYDYFRLLFARIGVVHCPQCGREIHEQSVDQILDVIYAFPDGTKMTVLAPMVYGKKGEHEKLISDAAKAGFARIRLNGEIRELSETITLDKKKKHSIDIVVDRIKKSQENKSRISEAVETAVHTSGGRVIVSVQEEGARARTTTSRRRTHVQTAISAYRSSSPVYSPSTTHTVHAHPVPALESPWSMTSTLSCPT